MLRYLFICVAFVQASSLAHAPFIVQFQWRYINYTWPSYEAYSAAKSDGSYIAHNNIISAIKLYKDRMYLTIPRYKEGIPVTLAVTSPSMIHVNTHPHLTPYPNWQMQKIDNCSALQNVQNMEIDPRGRMWVLDSGRIATISDPFIQGPCSPKLLILDLNNGGTVLRSYEFPQEVVNKDSVDLKDIVLDHEHGGMAYIADSDQENPGLIVYSLANNTSWKITHQAMQYDPEAVGFEIEEVKFTETGNINGLALSPASTEGGSRVLYFTPLSSFVVYNVSTQVLIDVKDLEGKAREEEFGKHIKILGRKPSQTDGMAMSNTGKLYFSLVADNGISMWDSKANSSFVSGQRIITRDHHLMQWPGKFSFDEYGQFWCISNRLPIYVNSKVDVDVPNYRAIMSKVNMLSYQYYNNTDAPYWPAIGAKHSADSFIRQTLGFKAH